MANEDKLMNEVQELKAQLQSISDKKEKSRSDEVAEKQLEETLSEKTAEMIEKYNGVEAQVKALEAKMQTPESGVKQDEQGIERKQAFVSYMRKGENMMTDAERKALRTDSDPDGGYLVEPEIADFVATRVFETSPVRQFANVVSMNSNVLEVLVDDQEAASGWAGEGATNGETSTPELGQIQINAHKLEARPKITTEMIQDSRLDIEAWLRGKVSEKFGRTENSAFINGDGVNKPRGILTYDAWASAGDYERGKLEQIASGGASTLTADGIISLQNALKEEYQANAAFMMKRATWGVVSKLKDADNNYLVDFAGRGLAVDKMQRPSLLGKPVVFADDMPDVASSALPIAYGDFSRAYTVADRIGISVLRDPFTSKGFVEFYTTKRTGGAVTNFDALKIQVVSS